MENKPHYLNKQKLKSLANEKILLNVEINRFNELDETFKMNLIITENDLILAN